ncbi:MAG: YihY/virulence factor BrkB family protein [Nitrospirota bacterium]|nr:YihY/virulence factor BrkB family protein [Nitrospirota bacterium]
MRRNRNVKKRSGILGVITGSFGDFFRDNCMNLSAAIAFHTLMSLFPLLFIVVSIYAGVMGETGGLHAYTVKFLKTFVPGLDQEIAKELRSLVAHRNLGYVGFFLFIWLSIQVFLSLEYAINTIFRTPAHRHFLYSTFLSVVMIMLAFLLFAVSFTMTSFAKYLKTHPLVVGKWNLAGILAGSILFKFIIPFILIVIAYAVIYKMLPHAKVQWKNAFIGAVITAVLWEAAKHLFTWYAAESLNLGGIYGSLSTIILFLLWIFYSSAILLFGAEIVHKMES